MHNAAHTVQQPLNPNQDAAIIVRGIITELNLTEAFIIFMYTSASDDGWILVESKFTPITAQFTTTVLSLQPLYEMNLYCT